MAERIGVEKSSIHNWETNVKAPRLQYLPTIVQFLGYNPLPKPASPAEELVSLRRSCGQSRHAFARQLGVDAGTLARWERGERVPTGKYSQALSRLRAMLSNTNAPAA